MSMLKKIFGSGASESIAQPITAVGNVLDKLFTSKDEKLSHEEVRMRLLQDPGIAQVELNKVEAAHRTIFVAGWRPFIGWVCGLALLYSFILRDIIAWIFQAIDSTMIAPPELAMEHLLTVLMGVLGLGGLRTYEKLKGKAK